MSDRNRPIIAGLNLRDLESLLLKVVEERETRERYIGGGLYPSDGLRIPLRSDPGSLLGGGYAGMSRTPLVSPGSISLRDLNEMMDQLDLRESICGAGSHTRSTSFSALYTTPNQDWIELPMSMSMGSVTYGGISRTDNYIMYPWMPPAPEDLAAARARAAQAAQAALERQQAEARVQSAIDQLAAAEPAMLADPAPKPPAQSRIPDYTHTITGWRGWDITNRLLDGLGTSSIWRPRRGTPAVCHYYDGHHQAPEFNCHCGYWSFKSLDLMKQAVTTYRTSLVVVGPVEIWGKVVECENGYRSEFAYPKELWLMRGGLEYLSWEYGVPVRRLSNDMA